MSQHPLMNRLMKRGQDFLNVKYPIICGAMTWVSDPQLVATVCNHGAFGCLAGGNTPPEILRDQIAEVRTLTDKPFAVNLITIAPAYHDHIALLQSLENPVPYVVFAGSIPKQQEIAAIKATGAKTICFASTISIAERMIRYGADALVLEGTEAGGHIGDRNAEALAQVPFK